VRLKDSVAVVTGAASGIGAGIALRFAEEGAQVIVNDRSLMAAESVSEKIEDMGGKAIPFDADVSKIEDVERMFGEAKEQFDRVDILVSNAGVRRDAPIHAMTAKQWDDVLRVQLKGCFNCVQVAQQYMVPQCAGKIVVVASPIPAGMGFPGQVNYGAANGGLIGLTTSLATELGVHNINVNAIAPDFIETPMTREAARKDDLYLDDYRKAALAFIPLRRLGTPDDVANVAVFLASSESSYVSGQVIGVKGGP
jgi:3-oxoacyl-[acyl-carrier protein] reductase|tara:strand:+ start:1868 stop:2626 length:759 start_codon:yes stop_codon:yes gene_type:complete